jgi:hypothetical protein
VAALIIKEWLSISGEHKVEDCFVAALIYNLPACLYLIYRNQLPDKPLLQEVPTISAPTIPSCWSSLSAPFPAGRPADLAGQWCTIQAQTVAEAGHGYGQLAGAGLVAGTVECRAGCGAKLIGATPQQVYLGVVQACLTVARQPRAPAYTYPARAILFIEGEYKRPEMKKAVAWLRRINWSKAYASPFAICPMT